MEHGFLAGPWFVDQRQHRLVDGEHEVSLSDNECALLSFLHIHRADGPVSNSTLLSEVLGYAAGIRSRALDASLRRLRGKLASHPTAPDLIRRRRGLGVMLEQSRDGTMPHRRLEPPLGRGPVVATVLEHLIRPGVVTVHGPSGIGKTAVARHIARCRPCCFMECASIETSQQLETQVAHSIGCDPVRLAEHLAGERRLLVLDNFEQLPDEAALLVRNWARGASILVTSIRMLRVENEQVVALSELDRVNSVQLLRVQIQRLGHDALQNDLERVVDLVGGHPLALILLAPMVGSVHLLPPQELLDLRSDRADDPDRHRCLRVAIERALTFISFEATETLRAAACFVGAFDLAALSHVAAGSLSTVVAEVQELVRGGFLQPLGTRFVLPPVVRMYAHRRDPQEQELYLSFLLSLRTVVMESGPQGLIPYRDDLREQILRAAGDRFVELCLIGDLAGIEPSFILRQAERRRAAGQVGVELAALLSYAYRGTGVRSGPRVERLIATLQAEPDTPFSVYERFQRLSGTFPEMLAVVPPFNPRWVLICTTLAKFQEPRAAELLESNLAECEHRAWAFGAHITRAAIAARAYRFGDSATAYHALRDLPMADMSNHERTTFALSAWRTGARSHAHAIALLSTVLVEKENRPHELMASRALRAALAWADGDSNAVELAEVALSTRNGGDGMQMVALARLVLMLAGRASSTGMHELDEAVLGEPLTRSGLLGDCARIILTRQPAL